MPDEDPVTRRELASEIAHVKELFHQVIADMKEDLAALQSAKRNTNTAIAGMMLTIVAGVVLFLLQRGLTP